MIGGYCVDTARSRYHIVSLSELTKNPPDMMALLMAVLSLLSPQEDQISGTWLGRIRTEAGDLRIVFNINRTADGGLLATLDSPDQGAEGIPVDEISFKNGAFHLAINAIGAVFDGSVNDRGILNGYWKQAGISLPLSLERTAERPRLIRPQEPKPPFPYREENVRFENEEDDVTLAGTLTIPRGNGPFPAVILVTGSGPQDRNETIFGHKPFWVLADHLTRNGIATLRYDDRGVSRSTGDFIEATTSDFAGDVLAALRFMEDQRAVDGDQLGVIGHSEGALIAPMIAHQVPGIDFAVLLAPPGIVGEEIIISQSEAISRLQGAPEEAIAANSELQRSLFEVVKQRLDPEEERNQLRDLLIEAIGNQPEAIDAQLQQLTAPWMVDFLTYDPKPALIDMQCPVLALIGENDLQVLAELNAPVLEAAFEEGGNQNAVVKVIPGLNHLFQHAETGLPTEYVRIEETISPEVLELVTDWILDTVR